MKKIYVSGDGKDQKWVSVESSHPYTFRPYERLRKRAEYEAVKKKGNRLRGKFFVLNFMVTDRPFHRVGIIVPGRFYRKAVHRNRIKRCVREWFRTHKYTLVQPGKDIVIIAMPGRKDFSCTSVFKELLDLCMRAGLMK